MYSSGTKIQNLNHRPWWKNFIDATNFNNCNYLLNISLYNHADVSPKTFCIYSLRQKWASEFHDFESCSYYFVKAIEKYTVLQ